MNALSLESNIPVIRAPMLRRALISGARRVISQRDYLNKINVFPVPDGDTGSNLAFTLGNVLTGALSRKAHGAGELLRRVSEHAIDGARGNSGAILATVVLFFHQDVHLIYGVHRPIFFNIIRKGLSQSDECYSAFMKNLVAHGFFL